MNMLQFLARAARDYAWSCIKNCVKLAIGRKSYFNDHDLFFRQYLFHITRIRRIRQITCPGLRGEGPGSQALMLMDAIHFARITGLEYVHTPFSLIEHADRPMPDWAQAWEEAFNLGAGEIPCTSPRHRVVNYCYNTEELALCFGWLGRREEWRRLLAQQLPDFRRKFYANKSILPARGVRLAVHLRRGEISSHSHSQLFTDTAAVVRVTRAVSAALTEHHVAHSVLLYSEGSAADFAEFIIPGVDVAKYRVGRRVALPERGEVPIADTIDDTIKDAIKDAIKDLRQQEALQHLVEAEVLIMAKSSFSHYAGLISTGIRICENNCKLNDAWLECGPDGLPNPTELGKAIDDHRFNPSVIASAKDT